jgi:tRNA-splicing endonuclease subunit Sen54
MLRPAWLTCHPSAQTTPMPTLHELDALFADLPDLPPPQPRKRFLPLQARAGDTAAQPVPAPASSDDQRAQPTPLSLRSRVRALFFGTLAPTAAPERPALRPNPFAALKQGKKIIVVAVVDAGSVGFFRFGEGCFEEWPMA